MKKACLLFLVLSTLTTSILFSQGYQGKGKIKGYVYDDEGNPVEGVRVKLYSLKADAGFTTTTDKNGEWKALWIRRGKWNIDFEKIGYEPKKISIKIYENKRNPDIEITMKKMEGLVLTEELKETLRQGNTLYDEGKYQEAIQVFQNMLEEYPDAYIISLNIGNCYFQMEEYGQAEQHYKKVLEQDPENTTALIAIGNCYSNRGRKKEAMAWYDKVQFEKIEDVIVLYNIGNSLYENSQYEKALKYYQRAVERDDEFLDARYQLGLTYIAMGKHQEALAQFESYLEHDPDSGRAQQVKGFIDYLKKEINK
ncbi:MAG: tetratricopeptide repeat protein [Candidatus Aminicenantes bacterium]